jgi:hypothetical protein
MSRRSRNGSHSRSHESQDDMRHEACGRNQHRSRSRSHERKGRMRD